MDERDRNRTPSTLIDRRTLLEAATTAATLSIAGCVRSPTGTPDETDGTGTGGTDETSGTDDSDDHAYATETVVDGLENPWSIAFLPDDPRILVTERPGRLLAVDREDGTTESIDGVPDVYAAGQGGLLDVEIHPAFPDEPWVYLTYAARNEAGDTATHLCRGQLDRDSWELGDVSVLHVAEPFVDSTAHYGSRIAFGSDEMVYMTTGDRQFKNFGPDHVSQDLTNELGATLRLEPDGSIPDNNPFVDDSDARDSIYSYGHRNAQGMAVHPETGDLWQSEHGENDGDSIRIIERGGNYGWPIATYACTYDSGEPIGVDPHERDDIVDPVYYWPCESGGFPPAGMAFYDGEAFPEWQGDLFVGNLAGQELGHFAIEGRSVTPLDPILTDRGWRVRAVEVDPDAGHLYVAVDDADAPIVRLIPE
nr:PQQ-dependent sugar dehydrogenase [Halalkalirubrum salinum]